MASIFIPKVKATDLPLDLPGEKSPWTSGNEMLQRLETIISLYKSTKITHWLLDQESALYGY